MTTIYLADDAPHIDESQVMDSVLLNLRKELRSDLRGISDIVWSEYETKKIESMQDSIIVMKE